MCRAMFAVGAITSKRFSVDVNLFHPLRRERSPSRNSLKNPENDLFFLLQDLR